MTNNLILYNYRMKYNLNELSHDTAIGLIRSVLEKGVNVKEVRSRSKKYLSQVNHLLGSDVKLVLDLVCDNVDFFHQVTK